MTEEKVASAKGAGFTMKESTEKATEVDLSTLILSLATGALIHLGLAPDPVTKKTTKNVELARQNIDILSLLQEKTKGNLSTDEKQLLENLLSETRMRFVEAARK